jgi:hypothetical protein
MADIEKFKVRFVVRGFSQREGVDYEETFALVARYTKQPRGFEISGKESNVCFAVNTLSQFIVEPRQEHWVVAKHVLRYLRGMVEYGLRYVGDGEVKLQGYIESDWEGSATDRKSTSRCCFSLGSTMISWFSLEGSNEAPIYFNGSQVADILTKPLATRGKFETFRDKLGLVQNSFLTKREC